MVKISVIAPVYGVEAYIYDFLNSIKKQKLQDIEVILVDDGSKDNCPQILDEFAMTDERYIVIHQKNAGVSAARNKGISLARGEYIYLVDSDDWLADNALEVLWEEADRTKADIVYGDWYKVKGSNITYTKCFPHPFTTENKDTIRMLQFGVNNSMKLKLKANEFDCIYDFGGAPWRGLYRRSIIIDNKLLYDSYVKGIGDDILFSLHVYEYVHKVTYISSPIYYYRYSVLSYTHGYKADYLDILSRVFEKQEEFLKKYNKDTFAWEAYYTRVLLYLSQGMERYFLNSSSPKSSKERYKEFLKVVNSWPYLIAKKEAPIKYIGNMNMIICTLMLRWNINSLYWFFKLLKSKIH